MGVSQLCLLLCKPQKLVVIRCYKYQKKHSELGVMFAHLAPLSMIFPSFPMFSMFSHMFPCFPCKNPWFSQVFIPPQGLDSWSAIEVPQSRAPDTARGRGLRRARDRSWSVNFPLSFYPEVSGNWCTSQSSDLNHFCIYTHSLGYPHSRKPIFKA